MSAIPAPPPVRRAPAPAPRPPAPSADIVQCVVCDGMFPPAGTRPRGGAPFCLECFERTSAPRPAPPPEPRKVCTKCGIEKPVGAFARNGTRGARNGGGTKYRGSCKACDNEAVKARLQGPQAQSVRDARNRRKKSHRAKLSALLAASNREASGDTPGKRPGTNPGSSGDTPGFVRGHTRVSPGTHPGSSGDTPGFVQGHTREASGDTPGKRPGTHPIPAPTKATKADP